MKRTSITRSAPLRRDTGEARLAVPVLRMRKCKACKGQYRPARQMQAACGPACAQAMAAEKRQRDEKVADRAKREAMKTRGDLVREAQAAFNAWVRARDAGKPCICCGRFSTGPSRGGEFDAGHYRSRGAAPHLRFDERNVHAQLKHCNRYAFDSAAYRTGLIERMGIEMVESLEADQGVRHYSADDLKEIKRKYSALVRALAKEAA